jgi:type IV secretory pathway protease TraF
MNRYTYVEVAVRRSQDVLNFLVPGDEAGTEEEMRGYLARRGSLQTIERAPIEAASLDRDTIVIRGEPPGAAKTGGDRRTRDVGVVDGSVIRLPESG